MKIVVTSDFHGMTFPEIPPCDLLLIGGDITPVWNHERQFQRLWLRSEFNDWLESVPARHIAGVAGNHDFALSRWKGLGHELSWNYLDNSTAEFDGLKVWGSPYTPTFGNWAFMRTEPQLAEMWETIPQDVDILLIHGPAYGTLDKTKWVYPGDDPHVGSRTLARRLHYGSYDNLKLFAFGHIHEAHGTAEVDGVKYVNASYVNEDYEPMNEPRVVTL